MELNELFVTEDGIQRTVVAIYPECIVMNDNTLVNPDEFDRLYTRVPLPVDTVYIYLARDAAQLSVLRADLPSETKFMTFTLYDDGSFKYETP